MLQSTSKKKIYFYLLILILLSTTLNLNIILKFGELKLISSIHISGLEKKEKDILEKNLGIFINKNIFSISKNEVIETLKLNSFLDNYNVIKIFPSELLVNVKKTEFVGKTILDWEEYYIGKNGKFTKTSLVEKEYNLPQVFGNFPIKEFLKLQQTLKSNGLDLNKFKKYYYYKNNRWDIISNENILIKLPSADVNKSLKTYKFLLNTKDIKFGHSFDLRINNKIIISN